MPLLVNSSVGSLAGTSDADGTMVCPFDSKYWRNLLRMSAAFMRFGTGAGWTPRSDKTGDGLSIQYVSTRTGGTPARSFRRGSQQLEDGGQRKSARLQIPDLARFFAIVGGR